MVQTSGECPITVRNAVITSAGLPQPGRFSIWPSSLLCSDGLSDKSQVFSSRLCDKQLGDRLGGGDGKKQFREWKWN